MNLKQLQEMAFITLPHEGNSMEFHFNHDFKKLKLISNDIELLGCKIYSGYDVFYLSDRNDTYLGHIEYESIDEDKMMILTTYANKDRIKEIEKLESIKIGLYEFMFKCILAKTHFKMIFGGNMQSPSAIKSWKKQLQKFKKKVYNTETRQVENFDDSREDDYWTKNEEIAKKYLVGISESDNYIKWHFSAAKEQLELRESKGRVDRHNLDTLVRFLDFDNDTALNLIEFCDMPKYVGDPKIIKELMVWDEKLK